MKVTFFTTAEGGILNATLKDSADKKRLRLKNSDNEEIELEKGSYDFEWHVAQESKAKYTFKIQSADLGIDIEFKKSYLSRKEDGSYFKINI